MQKDTTSGTTVIRTSSSMSGRLKRAGGLKRVGIGRAGIGRAGIGRAGIGTVTSVAVKNCSAAGKTFSCTSTT